MILVELRGGMGNLMFQYAAAKSLSLSLNEKLMVDISFFNYDVDRFDLKYFSIPDEIAPVEVVLKRQNTSLLKKIIQRILPAHKREKYREPFFHYDINFFKASKDVYLKGLRQSYLYFEKYQNEIKKLFTIKEPYIKHLELFANEIKMNNSISIHIRRGDYLGTVAYNELGLASIDYYKQAIALINKKVKNPIFYFFSDDIDWVRNEFKLSNAIFVSNKITQNHIEDFYLMSQCRHNIIANSTFSWWAAWLNESPEKIVVAPKKWFNKLKHSTKDLFPKNWSII